ncbi:uncharacterized protein LOC128954072 [Oppia nitens]|uniref:uncharacterized protein LOC128954072 n=1 Tax=Oppia nitens TaxID=1686743 RepID=UPI0023DC0B96|nr:uncharacterized protein LOC128954072 [Oppia nitens]
MSGGKGRYHPYKSALIRSRGRRQAAKQQEPEPYLPLIQPPVRQPQPQIWSPFEEPNQPQIYGYQQPQPRLPPAATFIPSAYGQPRPYEAPIQPQIYGYQQPQPRLPPAATFIPSAYGQPRPYEAPIQPQIYGYQQPQPRLPPAATYTKTAEKEPHPDVAPVEPPIPGYLADFWDPQPVIPQSRFVQPPDHSNRVSVIVRPHKTLFPVQPPPGQPQQPSLPSPVIQQQRLTKKGLPRKFIMSSKPRQSRKSSKSQQPILPKPAPPPQPSNEEPEDILNSDWWKKFKGQSNQQMPPSEQFSTFMPNPSPPSSPPLQTYYDPSIPRKRGRPRLIRQQPKVSRPPRPPSPFQPPSPLPPPPPLPPRSPQPQPSQPAEIYPQSDEDSDDGILTIAELEPSVSSPSPPPSPPSPLPLAPPRSPSPPPNWSVPGQQQQQQQQQRWPVPRQQQQQQRWPVQRQQQPQQTPVRGPNFYTDTIDEMLGKTSGKQQQEYPPPVYEDISD